MVFECVNSKGKRTKYSEMDLNKVPASRISKIHKIIGDALDVSIDDMEAENARLKERVKELEYTLMPPPILASPLETIQPRTSDLKLKGISSLLVAVRKFVEENIKKRMSLILEAWDIGSNIVSFGSKLNSFRDFLQSDFKNEEGFYKDVVTTFILKVSNMTDLKRKEEDFPSPARVKQLKACWIKKIKILREILDDCDVVVTKKEALYR
jgi:hypothetical protein